MSITASQQLDTTDTQQQSLSSALVELIPVPSIVLAHPLESARLGAHGIARTLASWLPRRDATREEYNYPNEEYIRDRVRGKVVLVTGGSAGLGKECVRQFAQLGAARIYLAARDEEKAQTAIREIKSSLRGASHPDPPDADIRFLRLDLASFRSIRAAAASFTAECDRLDILVLNAGVMAIPPQATEDGFEMQFGTNHLGHYLLTSLLLPVLERTASSTPVPECESKLDDDASDVRVITVTSVAWQMAPSARHLPEYFDSSISTAPAPSSASSSSSCSSGSGVIEHFQHTNRYTCYAVSKAANILFAAELARRFPSLTSVAVHPGIIMTGLYDSTRAGTPFMRQGERVVRMLGAVSSEREAVECYIWAATARKGGGKGEVQSGEYYTPVGVKGWGNPLVRDEQTARTLWEWSQEQLARCS